jgi:WD40 repeat protein/serine/threonine protein kinase
MTEEAIFIAALERSDPVDRAAYVAAACGPDAGLRRRVDALLSSHVQAGDFLARPAFAAAASRFRATTTPSTNGTTVYFDSTAHAGGTIGPYRLIEKLGEGGMGVVWVAEQAVPIRRRVALKLIRPGMDSHRVAARLEAERQALARMDHSNIARVFDAGATALGRPYFVMELVRGSPLTAYCDTARLAVRQRLELFVPVCQAVQHAHQKGVIHRDLKPSNILVAEEDGRPVPKVIDFGVAKVLGDGEPGDMALTEAGQLIGTLEYMSPEQAGLNPLDVDTRADVYALGVILYELLTGSTPLDRVRLRSTPYPQALSLVRDFDPARPSTRLSNSGDTLAGVAELRRTEPARLTQEVRGDLDWIVMKCLEKDRARRYDSAASLARDLERYLADEPVEARPPTAIYRVRKFARRHSTVMWGAAACLIVLVGGAVASSVQAVRATRAEGRARTEADQAALERDHAREAERQADVNRGAAEAARALEKAEREKATSMEGLARRRFYAAQLGLAQHAVDAGLTARALELLEGLRPHFDEEDLRTFEWYYLWRACQPGRVTGWQAVRGRVHGLAFAPDGQSLVACGWQHAAVWGLGARPLLRHTLGAGNVWGAAFSPDGSDLAIASTGFAPVGVQKYDLPTGRELTERRIDLLAARVVAFSPDGSLIAAGGGTGGKVCDARTGAKVQSLGTEWVRAVAFSPDGRTLAVAPVKTPAGIHLFMKGATGWRETAVLTGLSEGARSVGFSPDGRWLAACANEVLVWEAATGREVARFMDDTGPLTGLAFAPDGLTLATAGEDRYVRLWDTNEWRERAKLAHPAPVSAISYNPDGSLLAAATDSGTVHLWDPSGSAQDSPLETGGPVQSMSISRDGTLFSAGGTTRAWDVESGERRSASSVPGVAVRSPDGSLLAAPAGSGVDLRDTVTGATVGRLAGPSKVTRAAFSPDGRTLVGWDTAPSNAQVHMWDVASRQLRRTIQPVHNQDVHALSTAAFSPDGKTLAVGVQWWWVFLYDVDTGRRIAELVQERQGIVGVSALAYSRDGATLAAGADNGTVRLWDVATRHVRATLRGHTRAVRAAAFTPDGRTVATAGDDGRVRLWDANTGQERLTLTGHRGPVNALLFDHDGQTLVSGGDDCKIRLWRAATDRAATAPRSELDPEDPLSAVALTRTAGQLFDARRAKEAETAYRAADARLDHLIELFPDGREHWRERLWLRYRLATAVDAQDRRPEAEAILRGLLDQVRARFGESDALTTFAYGFLGEGLVDQKRFAEAEPILRRYRDGLTELEADRFRTHVAGHMLGQALVGQRRYAEAEPILLTTYEGLIRRRSGDATATQWIADTAGLLAELYDGWGKPDRAAEWRTKSTAPAGKR